MLQTTTYNNSFPNVAVEHSSGILNNPALMYITRLSSARSKQTVTSSLRIVAEMLGYPSIQSCPWSELKRPHVQQIIFKLTEKNLAPATLNSYLSSIKGVCEEAWMLNQMSADDYQKIYKISSVKGSRLAAGRALSREEVNALIEKCDTGAQAADTRDVALLSLLIGCGLRKAELISLRYEDINWKEKCFYIIGKGNKQAKCFLPPQALLALGQWVNLRGDQKGIVFNRILKNGKILNKPISGQGITYILKKRGFNADIENFAPHDTRRTFATRMFESGADALIVQAAMRHASLATTERYDYRGENKLKDASQTVDFFGSV